MTLDTIPFSQYSSLSVFVKETAKMTNGETGTKWPDILSVFCLIGSTFGIGAVGLKSLENKVGKRRFGKDIYGFLWKYTLFFDQKGSFDLRIFLSVLFDIWYYKTLYFLVKTVFSVSKLVWNVEFAQFWPRNEFLTRKSISLKFKNSIFDEILPKYKCKWPSTWSDLSSTDSSVSNDCIYFILNVLIINRLEI